MKMVPVQSSSIKAIGHEGTTLHVQFHSGVTYEASDVSAEKHQAFTSADSIGRHFNQVLKTNHTFRRL